MASWQSVVMGMAARSLRVRWHRLSHFQRHVLVNLLVGFGIELLFLQVHHAPLVRTIEDTALDWMVEIQRGTAPRRGDPLPFVWIDLDEETYRTWQEPLAVPRDRLAELVRFALAGRPALLIVDVDLTRSMDHDDALTAALGERRAIAPGTPVILARSLREEEGGPRQLRPSFLDPLAESDEGLHWASFLYSRDRDWTLRRWRMWEVACREGRAEVVPAVPLLAAVLLEGSRETLEELQRVLGEQRPERGCDPPAARGDHAPVETIRLGRLSLHVPPTELNQRIVYTLPWRLREGEARPGILHRGRSLPMLTRLAAHRGATGAASPELLADAIVVIGASFAEGHDIHPTPLGDLPGALVVVNSINSLLDHGQIELPGLLVRFGILFGLILFVSVVFARAHTFWALVASGALIVAGILPLSVLLFNEGVWLDFCLPLLAVFLHNLAAQYEETRRHHG